MAERKQKRTRAPAKTKTGAPKGSGTRYKPEFVEQVKGMAFLGATHKEIAEFFGVGESTITKWASDHPEFGEALLEKDHADNRVVRALYNRAIGEVHTVEEGKKEPIYIKGKKVAEKETRVVKEVHYVGDVKAQLSWLKNRRPDQWRDKFELGLDHDLAEALLEARERTGK